MLADHRQEVERWAVRCQQRRELPRPFGEFIAQLGCWDWFLTITFRDRRRDWEWQPEPQGNLFRGQRSCVAYRRVLSESSSLVSPPTRDEAMGDLARYFDDVQRQAGKPIQWMLAEEFGKAAGRFHCHGMAGGVRHLSRRFWWSEAFRRFGRSRIEPFDPERGAAFYAAKYAAKQLGAIHFGGTLGGILLSDLEISSSIGGKEMGMPSTTLPEVGTPVRHHSDELPKEFYRLGLGRWHR